MTTFAQWLKLPENYHMKVDYEKADDATKTNFRLFFIGGSIAVLDRIETPLSQREAQEVPIQS